MEVYLVIRNGYDSSLGENWVDVDIFKKEEDAKRFFNSCIEENINDEEDPYYVQSKEDLFALLLKENESSWLEISVEKTKIK